MLNKARNSASSWKNISLLPLTAQSINFADKFDLVFSNSSFQWIRDQDEVMRLIYKSLKKGGRVAVQIPAKGFCREFFAYVKSVVILLDLGKAYEDWKSPWHFPTQRELYGILKGSGFVNINIFCKEYRIVFKSINETLDWWEWAGLRPYLAPLNETQRECFRYAFAMRFESNRFENGIEFGFRRLFALARK
jgi:trans-aconitate methyltransferase